MLTTKLKYELFLSISRVITFAMFVFLLCIIFRTGTLGVNDNFFIDDLVQNWEKKGINEIYITTDKECENKSEFFSRIWEGTDAACNCKNSFQYGVKSDIFKGGCSLMQILVGCKEISPISEIKATNWKGSKLCKKNHESNFFDTITVIGDKCPKKYILCGSDTKNFNLCFPKKNGCPINKIKVTNNQIINNEKNLNSFDTLKLNEDWYMHFSNSFRNDSLIIDVKYTEGRVCINPSETNLKPYSKFKKSENINLNNATVYQTSSPLQTSCTTKIGKFNFDERYKNIDSVSKFKFFSDNKIMTKIEKLPHINSQDLISYNAHLYQRSYIHWSPYCRSDLNLSPESILTDLTNLSIIDGYLEVMRFYFIFIFLFFNMHLLIGCFMTINKKVDIILDNFSFILLLALISINILLIFILHKNSFIINKFTSQKCGDYTTNMTFNDLGKNLSELLINAYQFFLAIVIMITFLIIHKIIKKYKN